MEEWLYAWPSGKKQVWFERDNQTFKFGDNLKGENRVIAEVTRPNALFLSAAVQHKHPQLVPVFAWFQIPRVINLPAGVVIPCLRHLKWRLNSHWLGCSKRMHGQRPLSSEEDSPESALGAAFAIG